MIPITCGPHDKLGQDLHSIGPTAWPKTHKSITCRVLFKMALVPLQRYTFFLAQFLTVGNCVAYLAILTARRNSSPAAIPDEMLAYPKASFVLIGALEALGLAAGCVVAAALPGALLPVLQQTFLFWQLLLSAVFLGARFAASQVVGAALVMAGVALSVFASNNTAAATATEVFGVVNKSAYPYIYMASLAFPAAATILKEAVFRDARQRLACGSMDLFVLNSFSSLFQALFVLLFLPAISAYQASCGPIRVTPAATRDHCSCMRLQGIAWAELPAYLSAGAACFLGRGGPECAAAPLLAVAYVLANLAFNIVAVYLLKISSAVVPSLAISASGKRNSHSPVCPNNLLVHTHMCACWHLQVSVLCSVPLTVLAFTLPLPFIGAPPVLDNAFYAGAGVLFLGLIVYNTAAATAFRKIAAVVAAGTNAAATRAAASS
eukprot:jgi/Chlat1/3162/Chrsp219S03307